MGLKWVTSAYYIIYALWSKVNLNAAFFTRSSFQHDCSTFARNFTSSQLHTVGELLESKKALLDFELFKHYSYQLGFSLVELFSFFFFNCSTSRLQETNPSISVISSILKPSLWLYCHFHFSALYLIGYFGLCCCLGYHFYIVSILSCKSIQNFKQGNPRFICGCAHVCLDHPVVFGYRTNTRASRPWVEYVVRSLW